MITPENRTKFLRKSRLRKNILVFAVIAGVLIAIIGGVVIYLKYFPQNVISNVKVSVGENDIKESWAAQEYVKVIEFSDRMLASDPYDFKALLYRGFSYFYNGLSQNTRRRRLCWPRARPICARPWSSSPTVRTGTSIMYSERLITCGDIFTRICPGST
jgi:hypothetical protein